MNWMQELFQTERPIIGMLHLLALPASYTYDASSDSLEIIIERGKRDYRALIEGGISAVLFCNENDKPYVKKAPEHIISAMTYIVREITKDGPSIPFGIDIQWDVKASLAVAKVAGACFVRGIACGTYVGDLGLFTPDSEAIMRYRKELGAQNIRILTNLCPEFSMSMDTRALPLRALTVSKSTRVDAVCISGVMAGVETPFEELKRVKEALGDFVVVANTGVNFDTVKSILDIADGCCVATCIKKDGKSDEAIDIARVKKLTRAARKEV
ncbi:BtpA/SgcQ family protein [[Clostridium] innocuum]|nr:BtpA/SgcQ family protein [[Clostridium] innocuum]